MEMHQIRYFLAVCDTLNFTRAAEACNVTQPALTRAIQKLEEELGGLLFRRERSATHITDLGRLMKQHLETVLQQTEAPLNVGVMCTIGPLRFVDFLSHFHHDNPGIDLALKESVPAQLSDLLAEG